MDYIFLFAGLALLLLGANFLVDSSVAIAKRAKVSSFIIGLTIVGMGTSAPELFVSISAALSGHGDIAVGNVVGSNICNTFLILGVSAIILPFTIQNVIVKRDIPFGIFSALLIGFLANKTIIFGEPSNVLTRFDGIILLILFFAYMGFTVYKSRKNHETEEEAESRLSRKPILILIFIALSSLAGLIGGGHLFLDSAENLAKAWGVSEAVIAITVVAVGTSLPELITSIIAALKNNSELALGNVIGSNVFNILLILGTASTIKPLTIQNVRSEDFGVMLFAAVSTLLVALFFRKNFFSRGEGIFFLACYIGYTAYLIMR